MSEELKVKGFIIDGAQVPYDYDELADKPTIDPTPTANSTNAVQSGGVKSALDGLQAEIPTVDATPTQGSANAVSSGGVYSAIPTIDATLTQSGQAADAKETGDKIDNINRTLKTGIKVIHNVTISESGTIVTTSATKKLMCFRVIEGTVIATDFASGCELYAFYKNEPEIHSKSYNGDRVIANAIRKVAVPVGCKWVAVRCEEESTVNLSNPQGVFLELEKTFISYGNTIYHASINASGKIDSTDADYKVICYPVTPWTVINATGTLDIYAFYTSKPDIASVSYDDNRVIGATISEVTVPESVWWIAIRCPIDANVAVSPINTTLEMSDVLTKITPEWDSALCISIYGGLRPVINAGQVSTAIGVSKPIPVKKGDVVSLTGYLSTFCNIAWTSQDRINTYQGNPSYIPLSIGESIGERTETVTIENDGYIIVSAFRAYDCSVLITRKHDKQLEENARIAIDSQLRHNYVDDYDFVPNLENKRTNGILTYRADDKKSSNYMVNAVVYPNGEIIACRAGGQVVKIANDGTETVLLTIPNAQDWRGMFIDSNLNVYVSPHSTQFSPSISNTDRGLYKLSYGSNTFTKVISLCHDIYVKKWGANTAYDVNDVVFNDGTSIFYICNTAHTSGSSIDTTKFNTVPAWAKNTAYAVGDLVKYRNMFYRCINAHTSGDSFASGSFAALTEYINNDDTIWTMCEDSDGNLYAGVYAHSLRANPSVYVLLKGQTQWFYCHNFIMCGSLPEPTYPITSLRHVHCINYNEYDRKLYVAVGEVNTVLCSTDHGFSWTDMHIPCVYGQPTYVMGVKDGLLIGSDGHYSCGVSKLATDGKTLKRCGRTAPGFIFNIRRSDLTGWLYAFTRIDNVVGSTAKCPPVEAITDASALNAWKTDPNTDPTYLAWWKEYTEWASVYYPEDAIRPQHSVMMVSRDEGETWEVFKTIKCSQNYASICGFITTGYFRDGELLVGCLLPVDGTQSGMAFSQPFIVSEGKKKRTASGFDLSGEIFVKTNTSNIIAYED